MGTTSNNVAPSTGVSYRRKVRKFELYAPTIGLRKAHLTWKPRTDHCRTQQLDYGHVTLENASLLILTFSKEVLGLPQAPPEMLAILS